MIRFQYEFSKIKIILHMNKKKNACIKKLLKQEKKSFAGLFHLVLKN